MVPLIVSVPFIGAVTIPIVAVTPGARESLTATSIAIAVSSSVAAVSSKA